MYNIKLIDVLHAKVPKLRPKVILAVSAGGDTNLNKQRSLPGQHEHEHELESQHPMTRGSWTREYAGTNGRVLAVRSIP